ncbi:50S ribosomal protein L13 [Nanoarchaeota archaeon]
MIIDANNKIVGRIATVAAKASLLGENVDIVNCENSFVSGNKYSVIKDFEHKRERGSMAKGPFWPRNPERVVRRIIRGMLPYKAERGRKAFERIKCYVGVPDGMDITNSEKVKGAEITKLKTLNYIQLKDVCKQLGAKI